MTALAGIQSAVALIKKVSKTVDDVSSLGPVLGKYFDAKSKAVTAANQAKKSGNKSNMAAAIEIEMALDQAAQFEKQLQLLFMQAGKIDVWNKIKIRSHQMDIEAAHTARKEKEARIKRQKQLEETIEIIFAILIAIVILAVAGWGLYEFIHYCNAGKCSK